VKITTKQLIHAKRSDFTGVVSYHFFECDMSAYGYVPVVEQEITIDVPDEFNPVAAEIEMLRAAQKKMQADAQVKANHIEDQISKLSCLEYTPEASHG